MTNEHISSYIEYYCIKKHFLSLGLDLSAYTDDFMVLCKKYGLEAYKPPSSPFYYVGRGDTFIGLVEPPGSEEQLLVLLLTAEANPR